jgi:hypothetical protein
MKNWKVYVHTFPNNKKYFGITCRDDPNIRWQNGKGYGKDAQPVMYNAIQKYGWDNVKHEILFSGLSKKEAELKERELISLYKTNCKRYGCLYGYNMTDGGEGTLGHKVSKESKKKMSEVRLGKYKGKDCYKSKPVITNEEEWETITDFAKQHNLCRRTVEKWLYGISAMPIEWYNKGLRFKNETYNIRPQKNKHSFIVEIDGIKFSSQAQFSKYIGQHPSNVCKWINGDIPQKYLERGFKRTK